MTDLQYQITRDVDFSGAVIYFDDEPITVSSTHPSWDKIVQLLTSGSTDVDLIRDLAVPAKSISDGLLSLSERVFYSNGTILFDGDVLDSAIASHLVRVIESAETGEDKSKLYTPVVNFLEKISTNPSKKSRKHLYTYVSSNGITIHEDGDIILYKGVDALGYSVHAGYGIVDGVVFEHEKLKNDVGSVVEIPRSMVDTDRDVHCSVGLHAGTYAYANSFAARLLTVKVNPRDVVSVPSDYQDAKVRVSRYVVLEENTSEYTSPALYESSDSDTVEETDSDPDEIELSDAEIKANAKVEAFKAVIPSLDPSGLRRHRNKKVTAANRTLFDRAVEELGLSY